MLIASIATWRGSRMSEWLKCSYSAPSGDCVEVGPGTGIRDSKSTGHLPVAAPAWSGFLAAVKADAFRCR